MIIKRIFHHWPRFIIILIIYSTLTLQCGGRKERPHIRNLSNEQVSSEELSSNDDLSWDNYMADYIDEYFGHPDDPDYPSGFLGPSDEIIESSDPREVLALINEGLSFAKSRVKEEPRFLFAIGRAAYLFNYPQQAKAWLTEAANNGSAPAKAYLGFMAYESEDIPGAGAYLKRAMDEGFKNQATEGVYLACNFIAGKEDFERPDLINALYHGDFASLKNDSQASFYISKMHATLWEYDILWVAEDSNILLELDPKLNKKAQNILERVFGNSVSEIALPEAVKDARSLAILYNYNPVAFRKIYSGMREFMKDKL